MPYHPEYSIITNIDFDHPDYFTGIADVRNAFNDYAKQVKKALFVYGEDDELKRSKHLHLFTIMVLKRAMILSLTTLRVLRTDRTLR